MRFVAVSLFFACWVMEGSLALADGKTPQVGDGVSMDFQEADLKDVLKIFSQQSGLNFVAGEEIKDKKITLYLDKVSVEDALANIMRSHRLTYEKLEGSNIFVVKEAPPPPEAEVPTITKIYPLRYAQVTEESESSQSSSESGTSSTSSTDSSSDTSSGTASASTGQGSTIVSVIKSLLSENGKLVPEIRTNSLVITDISEKFPLIEKVITQLDVPVSQVAIEAEIIETVGTTLERIGLEYGGSSGEMASVTGGKRETAFPFPHRLEGATEHGFTVGTLSATDFKIALELLSKDTQTKFLARPKVMTLNNQTAEIKISADTAVASISTITAAEGGVSQSTTTAERIETGIILKVTPQINDERYVTMLVEPQVIRPEDSKFFSGKFVDPLRRAVKTTVMLKDAETLVLGGLIESQSTQAKRKVPLLGDIPIMGVLFTKKTGDSTDRELVVFVTPHVLAPGESRSALIGNKDHLAQKKKTVQEELETLELIKSLQE